MTAHATPTAFEAYSRSLAPQQRGVLILALWVNSIVTVSIGGAQLALVARAVRRVTRSDRPVATAIADAVSPATAVVASAAAVHKLGREAFMRRLDRRIRAAELAAGS